MEILPEEELIVLNGATPVSFWHDGLPSWAQQTSVTPFLTFHLQKTFKIVEINLQNLERSKAKNFLDSLWMLQREFVISIDVSKWIDIFHIWTFQSEKGKASLRYA